MTDYTANIPLPNLPMVDPKTGVMSVVWFRLLLSIFTRTGGTTGAASSVLNDIVTERSSVAVSVTRGTSPFTYTAPQHGSLLVSGGGVVRLEVTTNGTTWFPTGSYYGSFPLNKGAKARITYVGAPTLTFIPG